MWTIGAIVTMIVLVAVTLAYNNQQPKQEKGRVVQQQSQPAVVPTGLRSDILFTGNSFWGRYTNDAAKKTAEPYKFPFARLNEFERDKYDAWITGLECPTAEKGVPMTSAQMEATLTFNCNPAYLGEFSKWFTAVSLANNHTDNMGADGFAETQKALSEHNIQYLGHYDPEQLDDVCDVVSLPVRVTHSDGSESKGDLPVAICGYHFVFKLPSAESIAKITEYSSVMPTIVMPHGGAEYKPTPDEIKTNLLRSMVDAGADMVIGDHPHWIQSTEAYKDKLIVHSMGNFLFDQQFNAEVTRSAAIKVSLVTDGTDSNQLAKWLELGKTCKEYQDSCLEQAKSQGLSKIPLKYTFGAIATSNRGYQAYPAPEQQAAVEQRLRWGETMRALGQE